jgi:hypothetical protein
MDLDKWLCKMLFYILHNKKYNSEEHEAGMLDMLTKLREEAAARESSVVEQDEDSSTQDKDKAIQETIEDTEDEDMNVKEDEEDMEEDENE